MMFDTDSLTITDTDGLPFGWALGNIENLIGASGLFCDGDWVETKDQNPKGGVRLIQLADIGDGIYRDKSSRFLTKKKADELNCTFLRKGDLLIARLGVPIGKACIFPRDEKDAVTAVDVCIIRNGNNSIPHKWLMYSIISPTFRSAIAHLQSGTTRKRISRKNLARIIFPMPPYKEQNRIVSKVEELITSLDAGIKSLKQVQILLKKYRQSVLKSAVEGKLTSEWRKQHKDELEPGDKLLERILKERKEKWEAEQLANYKAKGIKPPKDWKDKYKEPSPPDTSDLPELPEGWIWVSVKQVGEVVTGTTPSKSKSEYYDGKFPFYKPTDLNSGYYTKESTDSLTKEGIKSARLLPKNSILVTCIGATIGKTGFIRESGAFNQQINAIITGKKICPEFIYFVCLSPYFQKQILSKASATTLPILNKSKFEGLVFALPPLEEQFKIVYKIETYFSSIENSKSIVESEIKRSQSLRQSILKQAFEGKLVPQDPNDEPASVLLERIKAEKSKLKN